MNDKEFDRHLIKQRPVSIGMTVGEAIETTQFLDRVVKEIEKVQNDPSPAQKALIVVNGDRQKDYGHPLDNLTCIGELWGALLGQEPFEPETVGLMMILLKISRQMNRHTFDNLADICGYAEVIDKVKRERKKRSDDRDAAIQQELDLVKQRRSNKMKADYVDEVERRNKGLIDQCRQKKQQVIGLERQVAELTAEKEALQWQTGIAVKAEPVPQVKHYGPNYAWVMPRMDVSLSVDDPLANPLVLDALRREQALLIGDMKL